ncbi:MAG: type I methionyl aminopeptidase [Chlorobi bacterium]|nr:type I methionyl aminopeptidase [Chlorobiota bacterium]MCI0714897.1 type I methionyl aminopeptidase [Chlorobiota bacterium]
MVKTLSEIEAIRESCKIVACVLSYIEKFLNPGVTTLELDEIIEDYIKSKDATPAFKGYKVHKNVFPANSCISINEEVVHGIPGERKLVEGDIVSIDVGVKKNGYYGDGAKTYAIGYIGPQKNKLMRVTEESLYIGLDNAKDGNFINDVSIAIQQHVESAGFSVVRDLVGHGIGKSLHEDPPIPNYYHNGYRNKFKEGMTVAIEPMVNYGTYKVKVLNDNWTYVTADGKPSAHFEHSVLITKGKPEILTL